MNCECGCCPECQAQGSDTMPQVVAELPSLGSSGGIIDLPTYRRARHHRRLLHIALVLVVIWLVLEVIEA